MIWFSAYDQDKETQMQTDISHLPQEKQRELERIAEILRVREGVEMVILFGSYARGDWREEKALNPNRWSGHVSDYDILVVVQEPVGADFLHAIKEAVKVPGLSARVSPIVHDIVDLNDQLEEGRYFFLDIKREGRLLHDSEAFTLVEPRELSPEERQRIAQADFDYWYDRARKFYGIYEFCYEKGDLPLAAFNLNQASESAYKAILLVFTGYCPHEHLLAWLGEEAAEFGPVFREIFPDDTEKAQERFTLLDRAYIGARYKKNFIIFWGDVDFLAPRVKQLLETTETICRQAIESLADEG